MKNIGTALIIIGMILSPVLSRSVPVTTGAELQNAMENALPGDTILATGGNYTASRGSTSGEDSRGMYFSQKSGTSSAHITVKAKDPSNHPVLHGKDGSGTIICLYLKGTAIDMNNSDYVEYWDFDGIDIMEGQKGVVFDACRFITMKNCSVSRVDQEGVHIRDNSTQITIDNIAVHTTGLVSSGYGEAFYIGTDKASQGIPPASSAYRPFCNNNTIKNCTIGPDVTAEHFDIKEGTIGNIIEHNTFDGTGISGSNSANTFINDKGQNTIIRYNTGDKKGNANIIAFGDISARGVYESGKDGWWYYNTFNGASTTDYMVTQAEGKPTAFKWTNTKAAGGNMYSTSVTWTDKNPDGTKTLTGGKGINNSSNQNVSRKSIRDNLYIQHNRNSTTRKEFLLNGSGVHSITNHSHLFQSK